MEVATSKLNLTVPADLKRQFKISCVLEDKTITEMVVELMKSKVETKNGNKRKSRRAN